MKLTDFIFTFGDAYNALSRTAICRVRLFINKKMEIYAVISELDENPSVSVTNAIEIIHSRLLKENKIPPKSKIIDHSPKSLCFPESFDLVEYTSTGYPQWKDITYSNILELLECTEDEFNDYRYDKRVKKEIYEALNGTPKIKRFEYTEPPEITERRLEIDKVKINKKAVKGLLDTYPSEREISAFLKRDMSLLSECYANPKDEYICFSEFPIDSGRVDFAVFTGRSRMTVYLIEIKGAQNDLCRKNHYKDFRSDVQEGRGQLIQRAAWIESNYKECCNFVHEVLKSVKKNGRPYNAFVGPKYKLQVDPNKDVDFKYVLIAGRTGDDLQDSHKRHIEDCAINRDFRTETWDSWYNKLERV